MSRTLLTGFTLAPTWLRGWGWRHPDSRVEEMFVGGPIVEAVVRAERAGFDFAFRPDAQEIDPARIRDDAGQLGLDPLIQLAALAVQTHRIQLVATLSATFADPFTVARQLVSLEHLAGPRIGWNLVTSLGGDRNHATPRPETSAGRWRRAAEFVEVVEGLRAGFPPDAVIHDRASGRFTDPERLRRLDHEGESFRVEGPLTTPSGSGGRLPMLQAGGSEAGRQFAARHADAVFTAAPQEESAAELRRDLIVRARELGRVPAAVVPGLSLFLGATSDEAWAAFRAAQSPATLARRRDAVAAAMHADLSDLSVDDSVPRARLRTPDTPLDARAERLRAVAARGTLGALLESPDAVADLHWTVIGTVDDAADAISVRFEHASLDGFIAFPGGSWNSVELACDALVPELRRRGHVAPGTGLRRDAP